MGLMRSLEKTLYGWWYRYDLPEQGDADYDALAKHWQREDSDLRVISELPSLTNFLLAAALLLYQLIAQLGMLGVGHWYVLAGVSAVLTYLYLNGYTEYRLLTWEAYVKTKAATVAERQRLADLQVSDPQGYYILLRRIMGSRFRSHLSYERIGDQLVPIVRLWGPSDLVEKLWGAASPLHVYLAFHQHSALVLILLSAALYKLAAQYRDSLLARTVLTEFTVFENTLQGLRGAMGRSGYPH